MHYGSKIRPLIQKSCEPSISKLKDVSKQEHVYVMVDGSMLLTREESWKEVMLGRVFKESGVVQLRNNWHFIQSLHKTAWLGKFVIHTYSPQSKRIWIFFNKFVIWFSLVIGASITYLMKISTCAPIPDRKFVFSYFRYFYGPQLRN